MTKLYCNDHKPRNVESESDDAIHIDIKHNTVDVESDSKVTTQKTKKKNKEKYQSFTVVLILKRRNLTLNKRREKKNIRFER